MRHLELALRLALCSAPALSAQVAGSFETSGEGCPNASLSYEQFAPRSFDLNACPLEWIPNGSEGYFVLQSTSPMLPFGTGINLALANDQVSAAQSLGFTFPHPGGRGSTTQIEVSSNGYVYLEPGTITSSRCCNASGSVFDAFRNDTPSFALFGMDLDPGSGGAVWFDRTPGVATVTWDAVPEAFASVTNTCQIQLHADGRVVMHWSPATNQFFTTLVGWSAGAGVDDDGSTDLSARIPFDMGPSSGRLTMSTPPGVLPTIGRSFSIGLTNVPADAIAGALLIGVNRRNVPLDTLGMPGCALLTNGDIVSEPLVLTPPVGSYRFTFPMRPGAVGLLVETQAAVIAASVNPFGISTSNRGTLQLGDINPVVIRADGADSFNNDRSRGFWQVINATNTLSIRTLRFDWGASQPPRPDVFDTDEANMADRFDGGQSQLPLCLGTYRNGSATTTGLVFAGTRVSPCDGISLTGWIGSSLTGPGAFRRLDFSFTSFDPGDVFEVDIDTDGGPSAGGDMAGLSVTVQMSDGSSRSGQLRRLSATRAQLDL